MFCRHRQSLHLQILAYVRQKNEERETLQMSSDWTYDVWYMWLSEDPYKHATLIRANYIDYADFCKIFEFAEGDQPPENYRISLWNALKYVFRRPARISLPSLFTSAASVGGEEDLDRGNVDVREEQQARGSGERECAIEEKEDEGEDDGLVHVTMRVIDSGGSSSTVTDDKEENVDANCKTADSVIDDADGV